MHTPEPMLTLSSLEPLPQTCPTHSLTMTPLSLQFLYAHPTSKRMKTTKKFPRPVTMLEAPRGPTEIQIPQTTGPTVRPMETIGMSEVQRSRTMMTRLKPTEGLIT